VTAAYLLLRSATAVDATVLLAARTLEAAVDAALAVRDADIADALEILAPAPAGGVPVPVGGAAGPGWRVVVRLRGSAPAVEAARERLAEVGVFALVPGAAAADFWSALAADEARGSPCFRLAAPPAALARTLALALKLTGGAGDEGGTDGGWRIAAHGAHGLVRVWRGAAARERPDAAGAAGAARLARAAGEVAAELAAVGGTLNCPVLSPPLHALMEPYHAPADGAHTLMRRMKQLFDPAHILSPGRHVV
jgi:FAD/FMN-containing dehydrogenase